MARIIPGGLTLIGACLLGTCRPGDVLDPPAGGPITPTDLGQFKSDSFAAIAVGGITDGAVAVFRGTLLDPDPGDRVRLDVEVRAVGTPLSGVPTAASVPVASGDEATVAITDLADNTSYHWQARAVDASGRASAWAPFGGNPEATPDFYVRVPPTQLIFTVHPVTTAPGATITPAVQVAAQDGAGNTLASFTAPIAVALGSNAAGGALSGTRTVNAVAGVTTFADLRIDRPGSGYTLVASATGPAAATSAAFSITPGPAVRLAITTQPSDTARSGVALSQQPAIQLLDAAGNAVSQAGATVEVTIASGGGTLGGTTTVLSNASGVAPFTDLVITGTVGPRTLGFTGPGLDGITSSAVTVTAGAPATLVPFSGNNLSGEVGTTLGTPHEARMTDANGNPVGGVAVTWVAATGGGSVNPTQTVTGADGHATTIRTLGLSAGTQTTTAAALLSGGATTVTFSINASIGGATQMSIEGGDGQVDTVGQVLPGALAVRVADQFNNPVPNVTISWVVLDGGGVVTPLSSLTDASGIAITSWTLGTAMAPTDSVQLVRATGVALPLTFTAFTVPGAVSAAQTGVTAFPATIVASSGSSASTLTVMVRDEFGNVIKGQPVVLTATGSGTTLTQPAATTDANGVTTGTLSATAVGDKVVSATIAGTDVTQTATVTVEAAAVDAAQSTVAAAPETIDVGSGVSTITVTALDPFGNPIEGATVVLAATGSGTLLTQPAAPTGASGVATGTLSAVLSGPKLVSAVVDGTPIAQTASVTVTQPPSSVVLVGAGDIGDCETTTDEATAVLLDGIAGTVFTAGDNAYPDGTGADFTNCYEPTWGRHKARTRPSPGNHDYHTADAGPYYNYFGPLAGDSGLGYYSYDLGDWHVISLNSEISMSAGSVQEQWLRADLATNTKQCTLAYWHKARFSSGEHGSLDESKPLWAALQEYNAELVVVGHDHDYERFAPQDSLGVADPARGLRQFVVGTGGTALRSMGTPIANSEVQNSDTHGVLKLTLQASGYEWQFIPVAGKTFTDSGSGGCH